MLERTMCHVRMSSAQRGTRRRIHLALGMSVVVDWTSGLCMHVQAEPEAAPTGDRSQAAVQGLARFSLGEARMGTLMAWHCAGMRTGRTAVLHTEASGEGQHRAWIYAYCSSAAAWAGCVRYSCTFGTD